MTRLGKVEAVSYLENDRFRVHFTDGTSNFTINPIVSNLEVGQEVYLTKHGKWLIALQ